MDKHKNEAENNNMKDTLLNTMDNIANNVSVKKIYRDGLYDSNNNFNMCNNLGIELITRIRKPTILMAEKMTNTKLSIPNFKTAVQTIWEIRLQLNRFTKKDYVEKKEYRKQSGVEGVIGAFKQIFKEHAASKKDEFIKKEFWLNK